MGPIYYDNDTFQVELFVKDCFGKIIYEKYYKEASVKEKVAGFDTKYSVQESKGIVSDDKSIVITFSQGKRRRLRKRTNSKLYKEKKLNNNKLYKERKKKRNLELAVATYPVTSLPKELNDDSTGNGNKM